MTTIHRYQNHILVFSKGMFSRPRVSGREPTITNSDFLELTKSIWRFPAESAKKVGHPAPFPVELPRRCIELYTYSNEVVLDPFMGAGATAVAATACNRRYIGYELDSSYALLAERRVRQSRETTPQAHLAIPVEVS